MIGRVGVKIARRLALAGALATLFPRTARADTPAEITVQGQRPEHAQGFSRAEVQQLPGALEDPLRAIEALPGVTPTLSGVPYFFVRGAPPGDFGYLFDGTRLPALFHALGGPSVIHPGLVESVELFPGPYPVQYGGYAGGIVLARSAKPSAVPHGEAALRATDSSALLDLPLNDSTDLTLAGRYSYANPVLHLFAGDMDVAYWDYHARLVHRWSPDTTTTLRVFGAHDLLTDRNDGDRRVVYGVDFHRVTLRLEKTGKGRALSVESFGGWDRSQVRGGDVTVRDVSTGLRVDALQQLVKGVALRGGASAKADQYRLDLTQLDDPNARADYRKQYPARTDGVVGGYAALELLLTPQFVMRPGVRVDVYRSPGVSAVGVDPRLSAEYRVTPRLTLFSGFGVAHQPPSSAVPTPGLDPALGVGLQTGVQQSYGFRLKLPEQLSLEVTAFQAALFNLSDDIGQARARDTDQNLQENQRGMGQARGIELFLKRSLTRKLGGFLSYTLARSQRFVGRSDAPSAYDRRHVLGAALGYDWGGGFRSGVRGSFYTGVPADVAYLEAAREPPRTRPYYRIDLRSEKRFEWGEGNHLSLVFEIVNTTLNREVLRASCSAYACKEQTIGPITIPNLGIEAGF
ncbi:MAG TPA: TonB-dependent receptor [Polyangiaceae bacterium]|nr:TonB-dependent receptor [Polyangiaceae bacterium]